MNTTNRRWMSWFGLLLVLGTPWNSAAAGWFNAKNSTATRVFGEDGVTPLSKANGRIEILYDGVVLNTAKNTFAIAGIFSFGLLIVPDVSSGPVTITLRVWDAEQGATFDDVTANHGSYAVQQFSVDLVTVGGATLPNVLDGFHGIALSRGGCFTISPPTIRLTVTEDSAADIQAFVNPSFQVPVDCLTGDRCFTASRGSISGVMPNLRYTPNRYEYGATDSFTYPYASSCGPGRILGVVSITIKPAPARLKPTLLVSASGTPSLFGLANHRYRIQTSADLQSWKNAIQVIGTYPPVELSYFKPSESAQFFRAIDITESN